MPIFSVTDTHRHCAQNGIGFSLEFRFGNSPKSVATFSQGTHPSESVRYDHRYSFVKSSYRDRKSWSLFIHYTSVVTIPPMFQSLLRQTLYFPILFCLQKVFIHTFVESPPEHLGERRLRAILFLNQHACSLKKIPQSYSSWREPSRRALTNKIKKKKTSIFRSSCARPIKSQTSDRPSRVYEGKISRESSSRPISDCGLARRVCSRCTWTFNFDLAIARPSVKAPRRTLSNYRWAREEHRGENKINRSRHGTIIRGFVRRRVSRTITLDLSYCSRRGEALM